MLFTVVPANDMHKTMLVFDDTDSAWDAFNTIADAFSFPRQPNVVCYGGYENALEMWVNYAQ